MKLMKAASGANSDAVDLTGSWVAHVSIQPGKQHLRIREANGLIFKEISNSEGVEWAIRDVERAPWANHVVARATPRSFHIVGQLGQEIGFVYDGNHWQ